MSQFVSALLFGLLLAACSGKEAGRFAAPEFLSAEVVVSGASASFTCTLSSDRVESCGVLLDDAYLEGKLNGSVFTVRADDLECDHSYTWRAFARAGADEILSEEKSFQAENGHIPIPDPVFRQFLVDEYDRDKDGGISLNEAAVIVYIALCTSRTLP